MLENATLNDLIKRLNKADFDAADEVKTFIDPQKPLQEQHVASVELMVKLNGDMQDLAEELKASISQLERAGKRVPHETDLLKNDVRVFSEQQMEKLPPIADLIEETRNSAVLKELASLNEAQMRILSVIELLEASKMPAEQEEQIQKQLAQAFANTPDASKYSGSSNYYGLFNKMMN